MSEEGGEDSPPRPKRKIKKVMVLPSDSSSDSDEGVAVAGTRRKRLRVLSDEGSDSSGSSVVCAVSRRKRALPKLRDSEGDSDTSGCATDRSSAPKATTSTVKTPSGFASDSSEGNSDKCSICLLRFTNQEVGTPQSCEHIFCLDCITEWSKNVNTCPVDRMTFDFIVVRACAGGRVLRTEPVKVLERRPSVEILVIEDPTICQVCGRADNEETMLLCDGCDLGYHMACLTPPLEEVPIDQWLCPNCDDLLSDVEILFSEIDMPLEARHIPTRASRSSRLSRNLSFSDEPSTSTGHRGHQVNSDDLPTTSRSTRISQSNRTRNATTRRKPTTQRRRHKRRRTKTVIIEYEVQENGKFPVTKRVKRKITKRKSKRRQPRTAARRSYVRASVRAKLASTGLTSRLSASEVATASHGVQELSVNRQRAGITALSLFGNPYQLDYFSEDDEREVSESASTAVAVRPTSSILSTYRQARRKMISIPSPPHASSAPDVLSSILESQTLLHSKNSIVSISVDGNVNIKVETREKTKQPTKQASQNKDRVDLSKSEDASKKVPSYPGQSRGGGGWGGGYRGNYHREQNSNNFNNRGGNYDNSYGSGGYQTRQGNSTFHQNNNMRRDDGDAFNNYSRRPGQYPPHDEQHYERNRRQAPMEQGRGPNMGFGQRQPDQQQGRYSLAPAWQPYGPPGPAQRNDAPPMHHRHSFGGFENPLDMRVGQIARQNSANDALDLNTSQGAKFQSQPYEPLPEPPMPPVFKFDKSLEIDKSEDEKSDSGLVIDTEKYDPTEPTNDDDSADDEISAVPAPAHTSVPPVPALPPPEEPAEPPEQHAVQNILAGLDTSSMNVPPNVLDSAVRAVLKEHRNLIAPATVPRQDCSDDDSEGDCPNFSIYSATSVHIASNAADIPTVAPSAAAQDNLEDLVQEDDDVPADEPSPPVPPPLPQTHRFDISIPKKKTDEELKDKVSKRCPITTNPRNPIKIKLNTPTLIKRHMSLYDDDEEEEMDEDVEASVEVRAENPPGPTPTSATPSEKRDQTTPPKDEIKVTENEEENNEEELPHEEDKERDSPHETDKTNIDTELDEMPSTPAPLDTPAVDDKSERSHHEEEEEETVESAVTPADPEQSGEDTHSEDEHDDLSGVEENDVPLESQGSPVARDTTERNDDALEKMTESISETEDERSYTPCLDENKSKDASLEIDKEKGIEGLDTEMISEDEGNGVFSDTERAHSERVSPARAPPLHGEEGEILDKKKDAPDTKKKKKKDSKKEGKDKAKGKSKKGEVAFKKLSKSGKERNYRERDKDKEKGKRERRDSSERGERARSKQRRKERRKDLERYDVRTLVSERRRRPKDAFGRDVSPRERSASAPPSPRATPPRARRASSTPRRTRLSASPRRARPSASPRRTRPSTSPRRTRLSVSPHRTRLSASPRRARLSASPRRARLSTSPRRPRLSSSPRRVRLSPSPRSLTPRVLSPVRAPRRRRRSTEREKRTEGRRRRSGERPRKRRRSASGSRSPRPKPTKRKKRARSSGSRRRSPRRRSVRRRRARRRSASRSAMVSPPLGALLEPVRMRSPGSVDSRLLSPRTPPPEPSPPPSEVRRARRRRDPERARHRRVRDALGPSKEVFTSGDNILVSVSFKEQERTEGEEERRERRRERRRRRKRAAAPDADTAGVKPVAIIDLERSPFRELTPSPRNVIVLLSDEEAAEKEASAAGAADAAPAADTVHGAVGPKTPPEPAAATSEAAPECPEESRGPLTPPEPPDSPDAYDPYEPTRSASASPPSPMAHAASPPRALMTLEAAQKTNMSADDVIDRRPLSPIEKVMALLQSTRDVSPEEPPQGDAATAAPGVETAPTPLVPVLLVPLAPGPAPAPAVAAVAPPVRIVLPSPTRTAAPKLFLAKPSPIKSDPIKPMPAAKIARAPPAARLLAAEADAESPYSPGSSDFGDLFEPPGGGRDPFDSLVERPTRTRKQRSSAAKVPVKVNRKKGKTQVGVKIDEDNLKILDDLPSSAVEMQVKSKFLKKLNRQERVVEEVKLVLKPHYNKKHVTKNEYKDILRRAVPKICHNKSGEINPTKIQALVEAYVKKFRKKHKLGLV